MGVDNGSLGRRYLDELWGKGNLALVDELVDPSIVLRDPMSAEVTGIENVRQRVKEMLATFSDTSNTIHDVIVSGDRVVIRGTWRGVHRGDFFGIPGTGKPVSCEGVEVLRIKNGKVVENISYFDLYTMFQQLGALPSPDKLAPAKQAPVGPSMRT
jgi:steroid delta-isomerase-like uncharacterized protein